MRGHWPWHLAYGLSPPQAPQHLPACRDPRGAVHPLPLHSLTALSPMTFSFGLLQPPDATATREMECSMQTPFLGGHNLRCFRSIT